MTLLRHTGLGALPSLAMLLAGCAGAAPTATAPTPATAPAAAATAQPITAQDLRQRVLVLADDSMAGREVGTRGARATADYLVREATRLGLRPAGDNNSYLNRVPLERRRTTGSVSVSTAVGEAPLSLEQLVPVSGLGGLPGNPRPRGEGQLVYAGYLLDTAVPAARELQAEQLRGAAVLLRLGMPDGMSATQAGPRMALAPLFTPGGPVNAVLLVAEGEIANFWEHAQRIASQGSVAAPVQRGGTPGPAFFLISPEAAERLIGRPLDGQREPRTGLGTLRYELTETVERVEAWNVAAVLPGSDSRRAGEYVALGAHYDHVGIGTPVEGDSIYSGADDNASGTATLLEVAEHFAGRSAAERPARSLLFVWHTAEESGLLGSIHFTDQPTVARRAIVAHINLDMVGRNHPDSLHVVGSRRLSTELGTWVEEVNRAQARPFSFDYSYDAPGHPEMIYCRSDHYSYARFGIPIVFFTTGLHDDYHQPSDLPETLDYAKLSRVAELVRDVARDIANRESPPRVDQPVPPLGAPCQ